MVTPQSAIVQPRVLSPVTGESLPLELLAADFLERLDWRVMQIVGGPGAGKTTALAHLAATVATKHDVLLLDDPPIVEVASCAAVRQVIATGRQALTIADVCLPLAPWGDDEVREFLWAVCHDRCAAVQAAVKADADSAALAGNPALWRIVLDAMLGDPPAASVRQAVEWCLALLLESQQEKELVAEFSLAVLCGQGSEREHALQNLSQGAPHLARSSLIAQPFVQQLLAGEKLEHWILDGTGCWVLTRRLPGPLINEMKQRIHARPDLGDRLADRLRRHERRAGHAQTATLLFAAYPKWRPPEDRLVNLAGGSFPNAAWAELRLKGPNSFSRADLSGADLRGAVLDGALMRRTTLTGARLNKATLIGVVAAEATLAGANLTAAVADCINLRKSNLQRAVLDGLSAVGAEFDEADLHEASFRGANLRYSTLLRSKVEGADFRDADLTGCCLRELQLREAELAGARFHEADLAGCDLEGIEMQRADFSQARLTGAYLTGSILPKADFRGADLRRAGLADIEWPGADLRGADLRGCTFHMGSSRSGLVGSPYPCHGSRTGFYTDDYYDQGYKAPEEIRKANLRGADLRGAHLADVDFYLVDLREALIDREAREHLACTGAILVDRYPERR